MSFKKTFANGGLLIDVEQTENGKMRLTMSNGETSLTTEFGGKDFTNFRSSVIAASPDAALTQEQIDRITADQKRLNDIDNTHQYF